MSAGKVAAPPLSRYLATSGTVARMRLSAGVSNAQAAARIGVARITLTFYESGRRRCPDARVKVWATLTGVPYAKARAAFDKVRRFQGGK